MRPAGNEDEGQFRPPILRRIPPNCLNWHALRTTGIADKVMGYTRLVAEF